MERNLFVGDEFYFSRINFGGTEYTEKDFGTDADVANVFFILFL